MWGPPQGTSKWPHWDVNRTTWLQGAPPSKLPVCDLSDPPTWASAIGAQHCPGTDGHPRLPTAPRLHPLPSRRRPGTRPFAGNREGQNERSKK